MNVILVEYASIAEAYMLHYAIRYNPNICDGDVLNVYRLIGSYFSKEFAKSLNPRYNLYIDRVDGRINRATVPFKDEITAFYQFNNI